VSGTATGWRPGPGIAIAFIAIALVLGDKLLTAATGAGPSTLSVYNRTTSPISFETGGAPTVLITAAPCSTVEFDLVGQEWRLRSPTPAATGDVVPVEVADLIPPSPDAAGPNRWEIVVWTNGMNGGLAYPNRPTPPPCDGRPRDPVHLSGTTSASLGPYRLAGQYRLDARVAVPGTTGCAFSASAHGTSNNVAAIVLDRVDYEPIEIAGASTGFTPDIYTIDVSSACGAWDIELTPQ
jgi:hypothetical protein